MTSNPSLKLTIEFNDPDLEPEQRDEQAQFLIDELRDIDEIDTVDRGLDPSPPAGNKAGGGFLAGLLIAQAKPENAKKLFGFLGDRLGNKQIELTVEANGKRLSVKASSREELDYAIKAAEAFISKEALTDEKSSIADWGE
jgi:hypothetical protein